MKNFTLAVSFLFYSLCTFSQRLSQIAFMGGATLTSFSFLTDQQVVIKLSDDGKVLEWGTEQDSRRYNYYPGKLDPYMGRVDYYGQESDSVFRGKVKSIGTCFLSYYGQYETDAKKGKVKTIGNIALDYFTNYEVQAPKGKLRSVGSDLLSYYSSYDDEGFRNKIKSVGSNMITYYFSFDDQFIKGKIKSIGSVNYIWYTSHDILGYRGSLKSGSLLQNIGGIIYNLR